MLFFCVPVIVSCVPLMLRLNIIPFSCYGVMGELSRPHGTNLSISMSMCTTGVLQLLQIRGVLMCVCVDDVWSVWCVCVDVMLAMFCGPPPIPPLLNRKETRHTTSLQQKRSNFSFPPPSSPRSFPPVVLPVSEKDKTLHITDRDSFGVKKKRAFSLHHRN